MAVGILDIAQWAGDTYSRYRDLVGGDPSTMTPTERFLREPLRAACRYLDEGDAIYTRLARAASDYVCGPLYDEPGNSPPPPPGECYTLVEVDHSYVPGDGTCGPDQAVATVTWPGTHTGVFVSRIAFKPELAACGLDGGGVELGDDAGNVFDAGLDGGMYSASVVGQRVVCSPEVADPYTPGDPVDTPYGPVTVEPLPGGPRIRLPGLPPIDVPFDPSVPPEPDTPEPPADPITPDPPQSPDPDGDVPFGDPPPGYEWVGAYWTVGADLPALSRWAGTPDTPIYYAGVGSIRLRLDEGKLDAPAMIYSDRGAIYVGVRGVPVIGARVTDLYGLGLQIQGIAAKVESNTETP